MAPDGSGKGERVWPDRAGHYWHWDPPHYICAAMALQVGWSADQTMSAPLGAVLAVFDLRERASATDT